MVHKNDEPVIDLTNRNWEEIAAFSFQCYVCGDRGDIIMNETYALSGNLDYHFRRDDWDNELWLTSATMQSRSRTCSLARG